MKVSLRQASISVCVLLTSVAAVFIAGGGAAAGAPAYQVADVDWSAVQDALGRPGTMMAGDVFRIGIPRTDLKVTVNGVPVQAGFALGSYAAFKQLDDGTMVMGDLVLLDEEVPAVMSGLFDNGFEVSGLHNHLNQMTPHVMYMHYEGHGDALQLAQSLHQALSASATPLSPTVPPPAAAPPSGPQLDVGMLDGILGYSGRANGYILRANALENNVIFFTYVGGSRSQLKAGDAKVASGTWHDLRVEVRGNAFRGFLEGMQVVDTTDDRYKNGGIGLWTKSDSVTCFDDVELTLS